MNLNYVTCIVIIIKVHWLCFSGNIYALRANLSIAIVAMVAKYNVTNESSTVSSLSNSNVFLKLLYVEILNATYFLKDEIITWECKIHLCKCFFVVWMPKLRKPIIHEWNIGI